MTTILPERQSDSGGARRFAPKGNRPVVVTQVVHLWNHAFTPQVLDPVSCVRCNLPARNGRHGA